jgi:dolichyl-phosphate beta-glucosyltransferase
MRRQLARFAVVGTLVTAIDVGLFVALRRHGVIWADLVALAVAQLVSFLLHGLLTFRFDPWDRWRRQRVRFASVGVATALVDVAVVVLVTQAHAPSVGRGLVAKVLAVTTSGVLRWSMHRQALFAIVRAEQVPVRRPPAPGEVRLSVVLPAYHEGDRIATTVASVREALAGVEGGVEIVVVDDGSGDGTAEAARAAGADQVLVQPRNRGKGAAVRAGMLAARGRTIAFTDADLAYHPSQLVALMDEVEAGWEMVVGSRKHQHTTTLVAAGRLRETGGRVINGFTRAVLLGQYRDTQCGLKAFRSDVARAMFDHSRIDGFSFDIELFVIAERNTVAVTEVPVQVTNTTRSTVHVASDAMRLLTDLFRIRAMARSGEYQLPVRAPDAPSR